MARYTLTAKRRAALRKAQLASAKKRRKFGLKSGRKLSSGHKKAIGAVVAGAIAVGAGTGIWKYTTSRNRKPLQKPPGSTPGSKVPYDGRPQRPATVGGVQGWFNGEAGGAADSRVITRADTINHKVHVPIRASGSDAYKKMMREMHGKSVPGGGKKAKYNVFEVSDDQWETVRTLFTSQ